MEEGLERGSHAEIGDNGSMEEDEVESPMSGSTAVGASGGGSDGKFEEINEGEEEESSAENESSDDEEGSDEEDSSNEEASSDEDSSDGEVFIYNGRMYDAEVFQLRGPESRDVLAKPRLGTSVGPRKVEKFRFSRVRETEEEEEKLPVFDPFSPGDYDEPEEEKKVPGPLAPRITDTVYKAEVDLPLNYRHTMDLRTPRKSETDMNTPRRRGENDLTTPRRKTSEILTPRRGKEKSDLTSKKGEPLVDLLTPRRKKPSRLEEVKPSALKKNFFSSSDPAKNRDQNNIQSSVLSFGGPNPPMEAFPGRSPREAPSSDLEAKMGTERKDQSVSPRPALKMSPRFAPVESTAGNAVESPPPAAASPEPASSELSVEADNNEGVDIGTKSDDSHATLDASGSDCTQEEPSPSKDDGKARDALNKSNSTRTPDDAILETKSKSEPGADSSVKCLDTGKPPIRKPTIAPRIMETITTEQKLSNREDSKRIAQELTLSPRPILKEIKFDDTFECPPGFHGHHEAEDVTSVAFDLSSPSGTFDNQSEINSLNSFDPTSIGSQRSSRSRKSGLLRRKSVRGLIEDTMFGGDKTPDAGSRKLQALAKKMFIDDDRSSGILPGELRDHSTKEADSAGLPNFKEMRPRRKSTVGGILTSIL